LPIIQHIKSRFHQEVVDASDYIFVSILPEYGLGVLKDLKFDARHRVINLMSDKSLEDIKSVVGDVASISHLVPLSFVSNRHGPIALYPKNTEIEGVISELGQVVSVDQVDKIKSIAAITGLMTSYYQLLNQVVHWGTENNLSKEESLSYTSHFFEALSKHARRDDLDILSSEMTPGGLNEQALMHLSKEESFKPWVEILDPILKRLK